MPKFLSVLFIVLLSFSAFAQSSLLEYGPAEVSGTSIIEAPLTPIVFLNQAPNAINGLFADSSFNGTLQQSIAENFVVAAAGPTYGITEIKFWGGYFPENIPNTTDDFTILIHSDAGGSPGAVIYQTDIIFRPLLELLRESFYLVLMSTCSRSTSVPLHLSSPIQGHIGLRFTITARNHLPFSGRRETLMLLMV